MGVLDRATAYWKGVDYSGSGDWLDGSGNGHDATPRNSPTFSGGVWTLNGTNQDFRVTHNTALSWGAADDATILVVAGTTTRALQTLASKRFNAATTSAGYVFYQSADRMRLELSDGTTESFNDHNSDFDINPEHFSGSQAWAGGRDANLAVARNGTYAAVASDTTSNSLANTEDFYIGSLGGVAWFWNGTIESAALWVGERLSEADLASAATELSTASSTGVVRSRTIIGVGIGVGF